MLDSLSEIPDNHESAFNLCKGDVDNIVNRILSISRPPVPFQHSPEHGIMTSLGIDLGRYSEEIYFNHLQLMYTAEQDRILHSYLGKRGSVVSDLTPQQEEYFDGTLDSLKSLSSDQQSWIVKAVLHHHWSVISDIENSWLFEHSIGVIHTVFLSWLYDHGSNQSRQYSSFVEVLKTFDLMQIALKLRLEYDWESSSYWWSNRIYEICLLIGDRLELTSGVGDGMTNDSQDVTNLETRLVELGFNPITGGSNPDFSSIERFSTYVGLATNSVEPSDRIHIWLACRNAPSNVLLASELASDNGGLTILPSNAYICSWLSEMLNASGLRLQKMNQALSIVNEFEFSTSIVVESTNLDGMGVEIKLPSSDASQDADSTQTPLYDQDAMKRILESLLADERIHDGCQLKLNDPVLAANGLCELVGERRLDPQDSSTPKFKQDFTDEIDWATASPAPDRLHVWIYPDEISDAVSLSTWAQESEENVPEPPSTTEPVRLAPLDEADQFDYYMNAIRSFHPTVVDPPAGTVELLGIAGWSDGGIVENTRDGYNDTILQIWLDGSTKRVKEFKASTAPGAFKKFYNIKGDAHLVKCSTGTTDGRYKYKVGQHKGYTALNQAEKFKVWRDPDKDGIQQTSSVVETGWYGINLHAAGSGMSVGNWSAGCQVIWGGNTGAEWIEFIGRFDGSSAIHSTPDEIFYTLINSQDLPLPPSTGGGP